MGDRVEIRWTSGALQSSEHCTIHGQPGIASLGGTAVLPLGDLPATITYSVDTGADWSTSGASLDIDAGDVSRSITLARDSRDQWLVDGRARPDLAGCTSVDLGWTPATNTLPLRAASLAVGQSSQVMAAWVRFPELDVVASEQVYTRLRHDRVRYESATFTAELEVSAELVVTRYAVDLWVAESYVVL